MPKKIKKVKQIIDTNIHESAFLLILMDIVSKDDIAIEHKFHPTRKWRFDFAIIPKKIAFEIEGGIWTGGRHIHPLGFIKDCEKYNEATKLGWKVYRLVPQTITKEYVLDLLSAL